MEKPLPWAWRTHAFHQHSSFVPHILPQGVCMRAHVYECDCVSERDRDRQEDKETGRQGDREPERQKQKDELFFLTCVNRICFSKKRICTELISTSYARINNAQWFVLQLTVNGNSIALLLETRNLTILNCIIKKHVNCIFDTWQRQGRERIYVYFKLCVTETHKKRERKREKERERERKKKRERVGEQVGGCVCKRKDSTWNSTL